MAKELGFICRKPGIESIKVIRRDKKVISQCLTREYSFVFKKARGMYVYDVDNRKYLDFSAAVAVASIGHTNPEIVKAVHKQARALMHCGFSDFYAELPVRFAERLLDFLPNHLNNVFLSNSGTESVEAAYKCARWHTNKKYVVAFNNAFHGRTFGSLSLTKSKPVQRERYAPFLPVKHVTYPYHYRCTAHKTEEECSSACLDNLEREIKGIAGNLAAIFLEPVQGEGGYVVPPKSFIRGVRKICDKYNLLLCDDEVQAGCYRTGTFLAIENFNVKPDIVSLSKAIGGGIPLGVTVANKKVMDWPPGSHGNTFGGNLMACAAGIASLNFMRKNKLGENSRIIGNKMIKRLNDIKERYEIVGDVRGIGLMIGIEIVRDKGSKGHNVKALSKILCKASEKGLILLPCGLSTIRICPPLTITEGQALKGLDILEDSIREVEHG